MPRRVAGTLPRGRLVTMKPEATRLLIMLQQAAAARDEIPYLIALARNAGAPWRRIADMAGMSHPGVINVYKRVMKAIELEAEEERARRGEVATEEGGAH